MSEFAYVGAELDLFAHVHNWKSYWFQQISPFLIGDILEVGAGIGANTQFLGAGPGGRFVCLEPDPQLVARLSSAVEKEGHRKFEVICGTLPALGNRLFDTILYIDVLEHIEHDRAELDAAASHLRPGGHLILLSPAHQSLFSPFDAAIGHFRRYTVSMLREISPAPLLLKRLRYLDSVGLAASGANRIMLRQSMPTPAQLEFWDRWMVPISRVLDKVLFYSLGKTVLAIWQSPR
jgi:2-polyprenyl-3-methyl-5-hydroxy-6-metoxy-1,4-benzoquinol methylase